MRAVPQAGFPLPQVTLRVTTVHACWGYLYLLYRSYQIIYLCSFICAIPSNKVIWYSTPQSPPERVNSMTASRLYSSSKWLENNWVDWRAVSGGEHWISDAIVRWSEGDLLLSHDCISHLLRQDLSLALLASLDQRSHCYGHCPVHYKIATSWLLPTRCP